MKFGVNDPIPAPRVKRERRQRQGNRRPNARPNPVTSLITPQRLRKETRAATNLAYRPVERQVKSNLRASAQRVGDVGDWWNDYLKQTQAQQADTQAAYNQAAAQTQGFVNQASALDNANTQRLNQMEAESAALRGTEASSQPAQTAAASQAQRNYLSAAYGGATANRGANQYAYLGEQRRIGGGQKIASQREEQKRGLSIRQDLTDLKRERGDYASKYRGELREKDRDYLIQKAAFPLKRRELAADMAQANADRALDEAKFGETQRHNRATERNSREDNQGGGDRKEIREGRRNAMVTVKNLYRAAKKPPRTNAEWAAFTQLVAAEEEISPTEAQWAVKRFRRQQARRGGTGDAQGTVHR